jgi:hypothetical protein
MTSVYAYLFAVANFGVCFGIVFVSLCRLHVMNKAVLLRVRLEYALYIGGAWVSALQPMWGEWPEWGSLSIGTVFLIGLLLGGIGWREGPPESVTSPAPLE